MPNYQRRHDVIPLDEPFLLGAWLPPIMAPPLTVHAHQVARAHTVLAASAFISALTIGCLLHYEKIVKNDVARYPEEWFPSVSATYVGFQ